ncbi:MAG: hypothetical protein V1887_02620 [Candidatus Aenigmatarchaeota archaeon]
MNQQEIVAEFEKKMGWTKTEVKTVLEFLKEDASLLDEKNLKHKLVDIYFQVIQLANRLKLDLGVELKSHMKGAEKKYGK